MDGFAPCPLVLPPPEISNLEDIEQSMRSVASTPQGRDALAKFVISEDYIRKLIPLVTMAEDLESLKDLHLLCNIMKMLILLNDSQIIDHIVNENVVAGVVGALECELMSFHRPQVNPGAVKLKRANRRPRLPQPQGEPQGIPPGSFTI